MSNKDDMIILICFQCNDKFDVKMGLRPRPYTCSKKCYKKHHNTPHKLRPVKRRSEES